MAAYDFEIAQHDTRPVLTKQALDRDRNLVSLGNASSAVFNMWRGTTHAVLRGTATVDTAADTLTYTWQTGDTSSIGVFEGEFEVTFVDGGVQTFPNPKKMRIRVTVDGG